MKPIPNTIIKLGKRIALLLIPLAIQMIYFPLNRLQTGGIAPSIELDALIPISPLWAIPYLLAIPFWILMFIWAAFQLPEYLFSRLFWSATISIIIGQICFLIFPTYVIRPEITESGWDYYFLKWIYQNDQMYNALPSGHAYITTIITLIFSRWKPKLAWLWGSILMIVLISTLLTGQHYILDIIAGCALSLTIFLVVDRSASRQRVLSGI